MKRLLGAAFVVAIGSRLAAAQPTAPSSTNGGRFLDAANLDASGDARVASTPSPPPD
jgi:hypothetical protein